MTRIFAVVAVFTLACISDALAQATIPEFHKVSAQIYRGGRPDEAGLKDLAAMGVKTILNLENKNSVVAAEISVAQTYGLNEILMPMSGFLRPNRGEVVQILKLINDPANQPVFVHCEHGQDRTGVVIGLHRVFYEKWSPDVAYDEMRQNGFHKVLFLLKEFYDDMTGHD